MATLPRQKRGRTSTKNGAAHVVHDGPCRGLVGVRVSSDEQLDRYGPDVQRVACLAIAEREGIAVDPAADVVVISQSVTKYVDATVSVALDGDFYAAIIERLKTGRYCAYLTYDMTRLTRSGVMHQLMLEQEVKRHAPRILYANLAGVDTSTPEGEAFKNIMAVLNRLRTVLDLARLSAAKRQQASGGYWAGEAVTIGFVLEPVQQPGRKRVQYRKIPYPPHLALVEQMLRALVEHRGNPFLAARALYRQGVVLPDFEPPYDEIMSTRGALRLTVRVEGGWRISPAIIAAAAANPAYEGLRIWQGEVVGDVGEPVIDPALLSSARQALERVSHRPRGRAVDTPRAPLADLLYCRGRLDTPHPEPWRVSQDTRDAAYLCGRMYFRGEGTHCLKVTARSIEEPVSRVVLSELRLGALADDVVAELEREHADAAARSVERDQVRRRLSREVTALEGNLGMLLQSELLTPERYATMERKIAGKRAELQALDVEPIPTVSRHLDAQQAATVRQLLDNLEARWPTLPSDVKNDLLGIFLERIELMHSNDAIVLRLRWITGHEQGIVVERPGYRPRAETFWSPDEDARLRALYPAASEPELEAAFPDRTLQGIASHANILGIYRTQRRVSRAGHGPRFTEAEDAIVRAFASGELDLAEAMERSGRSAKSLEGRRLLLGLFRKRKPEPVRWHLVRDAEQGQDSSNEEWSAASFPRLPRAAIN